MSGRFADVKCNVKLALEKANSGELQVNFLGIDDKFEEPYSVFFPQYSHIYLEPMIAIYLVSLRNRGHFSRSVGEIFQQMPTHRDAWQKVGRHCLVMGIKIIEQMVNMKAR